jgi:hypothetical protein
MNIQIKNLSIEAGYYRGEIPALIDITILEGKFPAPLCLINLKIYKFVLTIHITKGVIL